MLPPHRLPSRQARATPAGWSLTGEPDFTPAGALTAAQLAALRSEGWTCPELRELGYHLVWARGGVLAGVDIVELRLTDGRNFATILEQHGGLPGQSGTREGGPRTARAGQRAHGPSRDVGRLHRRDAARRRCRDGRRAEPGRHRTRQRDPVGQPWPPFAAIYQADDATFTYVSDQPAEQADDGVAALVQAGTGPPGRPPGRPGSRRRAQLHRAAGARPGQDLELLAP